MHKNPIMTPEVTDTTGNSWKEINPRSMTSIRIATNNAVNIARITMQVFVQQPIIVLNSGTAEDTSTMLAGIIAMNIMSIMPTTMSFT